MAGCEKKNQKEAHLSPRLRQCPKRREYSRGGRRIGPPTPMSRRPAAFACASFPPLPRLPLAPQFPTRRLLRGHAVFSVRRQQRRLQQLHRRRLAALVRRGHVRPCTGQLALKQERRRTGEVPTPPRLARGGSVVVAVVKVLSARLGRGKKRMRCRRTCRMQQCLGERKERRRA